MTLAVGSVSVDSAGVVSGSGYLRALFDISWPYLLASISGPPFDTIYTPAIYLDIKQKLAAGMSASSGEIITYLLANTVVNITVPANAFGSGIPSAPVNLTGTIT